MASTWHLYMVFFIVHAQNIFHLCRLTRFRVSYDHIHCVPGRISRPSGHCGPPLPGSWSWSIDPVADQREANGQNIQVSDNVRNCVRVIIDASSSTPFPLCFVGVCVLLFDFFFFDGASSSSDNRLGLLSVERLRLSTPARIRILRVLVLPEVLY